MPKRPPRPVAPVGSASGLRGRRLVDRFLAELPAELRARASTERLRPALARAVGEAQAAWPQLKVPVPSFAAFLGRKAAASAAPAPHDESVAERLGQLHVADLYVAFGCLAGQAAANAALEATAFAGLDAALGRMGASPDAISEVKQRVREHLLIANRDREPHLADYAGVGSLRGWVRVIATREAGRLLRKARQEIVLGDEALLDRLAHAPEDPEAAHLRRTYRKEFSRAFERALMELEPKERTVLRHQVIDGLTIDQIGALYRVNRTTAFRWLAKVREKLLACTKRTLLKQLRLRKSELESLLRLLRSELDVSIRKLLQ